jgi:hypothetical protein
VGRGNTETQQRNLRPWRLASSPPWQVVDHPPGRRQAPDLLVYADLVDETWTYHIGDSLRNLITAS